ncbi:fimbrial protein [Citrobacter amalonaticus]|uniref:fimbrial protein n=1 Tax=Citrobacter amalonaticus TaxID=35703 RepID=UPI003D6DCFAB
MYKFILALFIAFLSLSSLPAMAANCSGGTILFGTDPSDRGYGMYTSANDEPLLIMQVTVQNNMACDPDFIDQGAIKQSQMIFKMTSGGTCKDSTTITTPYPGIEWKLEGMHCAFSSISSDNIKSGAWDGKIQWPSGTVLGKAKLIVNDEYWMQNRQTGAYTTINIPSLSVGNTLSNSPSVSVGSTRGFFMRFQLQDAATCSMNLSTENLDFGKLTPININNSALYKDLSVYYSCKNKALINGLYLRFDPENIVDAANGIFSANDKNGHKLNFKITRLNGYEQTMPLNANYQIRQSIDADLDATETFRIRVMPSTPFPAGKISTYLNVSLIYR